MVDIERIIGNFLIDGKYESSECYGQGHINDTFAANFKMSDGTSRRYIFQRVNHTIFKEPIKLMENIVGVTNFLRNKIIENGGDPDRETLNLIPAVHGNYFVDSENDVWRGYVFIENATSIQIPGNSGQLYSAGKAFGKFQRMLSEYPAETLHETIKDFHNTPKRFEHFIEVLEKDSFNRAKDVKAEIDFILKRAGDAPILVDLLESGKIPLRVTHNDTKLNNVMIDNDTGEGICVIDLDTVLPGASIYDFGDGIRYGSNPGAEDEQDLSKVWMDLDYFKQYTKGFLEESASTMNSTEIEFMPAAAKIMTYECGMRFLTDFLEGDVYFKTHRDFHNIHRARTQIKIISDMESKLDEMRKIVGECIE